LTNFERSQDQKRTDHLKEEKKLPPAPRSGRSVLAGDYRPSSVAQERGRGRDRVLERYWIRNLNKRGVGKENPSKGGQGNTLAEAKERKRKKKKGKVFWEGTSARQSKKLLLKRAAPLEPGRRHDGL